VGDRAPTYLAAAVQMAPVWLDREATTEKVCAKIVELGRQGVRLIVFPEVIIPGTPHWNWIEPTNSELYVRLYQNAVELPSETLRRVASACRSASAYVVLGVHERAGKSLYNTLLFLDDQGNLLGRHRKLVPTHSEKILWAAGDGSGLRVYRTPLGRLGGLICAEHNMSLARFALAQQGEEVHAAVYVSGSARRGELFNRWVEIWSCSYALANQVFVVCAQACASREEIERFGFPGPGGWSAIIAPDGTFVAGPAREGEADVIGEMDLAAAVRTYVLFDTVGYHGRPDVFHFELRQTGMPDILRQPLEPLERGG